MRSEGPPPQAAAAAPASASASNEVGGAAPAPDAPWTIVWCFDGWHPLRRRLEALLPGWARLRALDPSRPLHAQVEDAQVKDGPP
jgi:hypothetical protein